MTPQILPTKHLNTDFLLSLKRFYLVSLVLRSIKEFPGWATVVTGCTVGQYSSLYGPNLPERFR